MIPRNISPLLKKAATSWPSITLTGARQSGKTTLCKHLFSNHLYVNLEDPENLSKVKADPRDFLSRCKNGAIFDEIQRFPLLYSCHTCKVSSTTTPHLASGFLQALNKRLCYNL